MRTYLTISSLLAFAVLGFAVRPVYAASDTCKRDADCVKGWTCVVSVSTSCATPACPPGEKCDETPIDCVSEELESCQPGPCRADADCASGMVCYSRTETVCPTIGCAPGEECTTPRCEPTTETACVPRYLLPCTEASDCGAGFECESAGEQCQCSGSSGSGDDASDGDLPAPAPEEPSCTCEPSKELRCHAAEVSCSADKDCAAGWTCADISSRSDCASPAPDDGASGGAAPAPDCPPAQTVKQCVPPYYALVGSVKGVDRDSSGSPTLGGTGDGSGAPTAESGGDTASSSGGCSVSLGGRSGSTLALLGALGLFGVLRRRRAS